MNGVIYARYSSDRQREASIEDQVRECRAYAEQNGIKVVNVYTDKALSASKETEKRLDFLRMIDESQKGLFEVVIVWKLDRFARDRYDSANYKHILKKNGVKVVSATEHITDGPEGVLMESVLEGMAEYYSRELSEKIRRGQKGNALKGMRNGGLTPMGYKLNDHKLEIDPVSAPVVREIFKRYADGDTIKDIIADLDRRGIKSRSGKTFTYSFLGNMLKNRTYIGEFHYGEVVLPDAVPAIIDPDIFERVKTRMEKNRHMPAQKKARDEYLLTGKLYCGNCERLMVGESGTSHTQAKHYYYKCRGAKRKMGCNKKPVKKQWIEDIVVAQTMLFIQNNSIMEGLIERLLDMQGEKSFDLKLLERQSAEVGKSIENIMAAIEAGIITTTTKTRLMELEGRQEKLKLQILTEQMKRPALSREQISAYIYQFRGIDTSDFSERQRLIDNFVNAVYVFDDRLIFSFNFTENSKTVSLEEIEQSTNNQGSDLFAVCPPAARRRTQDAHHISWCASVFCPRDSLF